MSSPMMNRMLGFCCGCCAKAGAIVAIPPAHNAARPSEADLLVLITALLQVECLAAPGSDVVSAGEAHGRFRPDSLQIPPQHAIVLKGRFTRNGRDRVRYGCVGCEPCCKRTMQTRVLARARLALSPG